MSNYITDKLDSAASMAEFLNKKPTEDKLPLKDYWQQHYGKASDEEVDLDEYYKQVFGSEADIQEYLEYLVSVEKITEAEKAKRVEELKKRLKTTDKM